MNFEKRSDDSAQQPVPETEKPAKGKKPVIVYIMVLFIVAFLLMALSFFSHQRSNDAALGRLQSSVANMQDIQAAQEKIIDLQDELALLEKSREDLEEQIEDFQGQCIAAQEERNALLGLYQLQQYYSNEDYAACEATIAAMEKAGYPALLDAESAEGVTAPQLRFQQLKEAALAKLNGQTPPQ